LHDSLQHELKQAKDLALLDSANVIEHRTYIGILERQIIELDAQKQAMQSIVDKQSKNYKSLQKSAKKELRKSKIKTWLITPASAVGGFVVGFVIGKFLY
jgi:6-phosphogluconate dehydrogenase (decarboxylating)